jgi:hypothetical protein
MHEAKGAPMNTSTETESPAPHCDHLWSGLGCHCRKLHDRELQTIPTFEYRGKEYSHRERCTKCPATRSMPIEEHLEHYWDVPRASAERGQGEEP